mmetsp:Transcript_2537/g.3673  ORF Transcript_2537/g.3673 Transcript_2537/m.3673 type:complete len:314 (+) Transcript_2537:80-1021(+)
MSEEQRLIVFYYSFLGAIADAIFFVGLIIAGIVGLFIIVIGSIHTVPFQNKGVFYDAYSKTLSETIEDSGTKIKFYPSYYITFPTIAKIENFNNLTTRSSDGILVELGGSYTYKWNEEHFVDTLKLLGYDFELHIHKIFLHGLLDASSNLTAVDFLTSPTVVASIFSEEISKRLSIYGVDLTQINIKDLTLPRSYEQFVATKSQTVQRKNEAEQQVVVFQTQANSEILSAENQAKVRILNVEGEESGKLLGEKSILEAQKEKLIQQSTTYKTFGDRFNFSPTQLITYLFVKVLEVVPAPFFNLDSPRDLETKI